MAQRLFCIQNKWQDILYHLTKGHCCSFLTSWVIKQQKSCILKVLEKTPNLGRTVRTLDYSWNLKLKFSEDF